MRRKAKAGLDLVKQCSFTLAILLQLDCVGRGGEGSGIPPLGHLSYSCTDAICKVPFNTEGWSGHRSVEGRLWGHSLITISSSALTKYTHCLGVDAANDGPNTAAVPRREYCPVAALTHQTIQGKQYSVKRPLFFNH